MQNPRSPTNAFNAGFLSQISHSGDDFSDEDLVKGCADKVLSDAVKQMQSQFALRDPRASSLIDAM
jgi:hypothetical protein